MKNTTMLSCQRCFYSTPTKVIVPLSALALVVTGVTLLILKHSPTLSGCLLGGGVCMSALLIPLFRPRSLPSQKNTPTVPKGTEENFYGRHSANRNGTPTTWATPKKTSKNEAQLSLEEYKKEANPKKYTEIIQSWKNTRSLPKYQVLTLSIFASLVGLENESFAKLLEQIDPVKYKNLQPEDKSMSFNHEEIHRILNHTIFRQLFPGLDKLEPIVF